VVNLEEIGSSAQGDALIAMSYCILAYRFMGYYKIGDYFFCYQNDDGSYFFVISYLNRLRRYGQT